MTEKWREFRVVRNQVNNMNKRLKKKYYNARLNKPFNSEGDDSGTDNFNANDNSNNNGTNFNYMDSLHNKGTSFDKKMWSTVKNMCNKNKQTPPRMIIHENNKVTSIKTISNIAKKFYIEKVVTLRNKFTMPLFTAMDFFTALICRNNNEWKLRPITIDQTLEIIKNSKSTNSV